MRILERPPLRRRPALAWAVGLRLGLGIFLAIAAQSPRALEAAPAAGDAGTSRSLLFRVPPHARFVTPDSVAIAWETDEPSGGVVEYGLAGKWDQQVPYAGPKTAQQITLSSLEPRARYQYRIRANPFGREAAVSEAFEFDNALNYAVARVPETGSPYPSDARSRQCIQVAEHILTASGITRGYCLVLDCNEGQLAYEFAKRSELILLGVDRDADRVARARALLTKAGVYGSRITLRHVDSPERLPCPDSFANLVVADGGSIPGRLPTSAAQIVSWLQPATGVAYLGPLPAASSSEARNGIAQWLGDAKCQWDLVESPAGRWVRLRAELPPDTGSWTHQYGDAGNTANSQEGLQGVAATDRLDVQWLGRPGADFGLDRNPRMPAPLAVNGRLFHQGLNRLVALDSYNGAVLWSAEIPALRRVNMPRDCGNWCADAEHVYVAIRNRCWVMAAGTGELVRTLPLADPGLQESHEWGYVGRAGGLVYGSSVRRGAVYTNFWGHASWYDATSGLGTEKICSHDLFARTTEGAELKWHYRGGVVINSTIGIASGKVLFVECRNPEFAALATSRIGSPKLWEDQHLMALDARTGKTVWDQPVDTADGIVVFFLLATPDRVFLMASGAGKYHLYAFAAENGESLWQAGHDWPKDNHGGHMQHPVVVRDTVFLEPCGYDAATGRRVTQGVGRHGGCATYAATLHALVYRGDGGHISMWDIERGSVTGWHNLRPSCWLSTVPANGMVLSPEGGGGCSCGNWLETSIGFAPAPGSKTK